MSSRLILSGLRSIEECIRTNPKRIAKLLIPPGRMSPRLEELCSIAKEAGIFIEENPKYDPEDPLLAVLRDYEYQDFDEFINSLREQLENYRTTQTKKPVVLLLDGVTDPNNLGAILRTAAFFGIAGVVLPKDRSAQITSTVYRIASGGLEHIKVCSVTNLVRSMEALKEAGFWIVSFSEHADKNIKQISNDFPIVLVVGSEEKGIRPLVLKNSDHVVCIPSRGGLRSLNASVATALAIAWASES